MKHKQAGMTLLGFIIVLAVAGFFAYIGMKLFPMYQEYYAVKQSLKGLANEPGIGAKDQREIKDLFFRRLYINYSENVKPEDVTLKRADNGLDMRVNYEVRRPLVGNLDVVGKFDTTQHLSNAGAID